MAIRRESLPSCSTIPTRAPRCAPCAATLLLGLLSPASASFAQEGQGATRPPAVNAEGLLAVDETFFETAAVTGGDFAFWTPAEFASSNLELPLGGEPILLTHGTLDGTARTFTFPVDGTTSGIDVFIGAQLLPSARLVRPDGAVVAAGDAGVRYQAFKRQAFITLSDPMRGRWSLEATGKGKYLLSVRARTVSEVDPIYLGDLRYVEVAGRPGHEGLFDVGEAVGPGEHRTCSVGVDGPVREVRFELLGVDDRVLSVLELAPDEPGAVTGTEHVGPCTVPDEPFRLRVTGLDADGFPFQRMESALRIDR